jgi:hypothetical protein
MRRPEASLDARGVFGLEIMVAREAESSAVAIAVCAHQAGWARRSDTDLAGAIPITLEFISSNPPVKKGTLYGTKQQHAA